VADLEVDEALARSFLAGLPAELAGRLRAEGERADYRRARRCTGQVTFRRQRWLSVA
jgi:hypothetical protein